MANMSVSADDQRSEFGIRVPFLEFTNNIELT
jgi:hypothetical protein